ncbi:MAG: hypothetical protein L0Y72_25105 [Gemmataceae bacterium]|nr:hypothetical protein [Gemmataceae bacterium]MCI0742323.1 hypothetical protein [Gemmataceae bacterium]
MKRLRWLVLSQCAVAALASWQLLFAGQANFDKLGDEDRKTFAARFEKEIWPLMTRDGKKGCVGCHSGKIVAALKLTGDMKKDFQFLLKEGFFLQDDDGNLVARVSAKDTSRRMPKGGERWAEKDIQMLRKFIADIDSKQKK